jgi:hypothetical protein
MSDQGDKSHAISVGIAYGTVGKINNFMKDNIDNAGIQKVADGLNEFFEKGDATRINTQLGMLAKEGLKDIDKIKDDLNKAREIASDNKVDLPKVKTFNYDRISQGFEVERSKKDIDLYIDLSEKAKGAAAALSSTNYKESGSDQPELANIARTGGKAAYLG